MFYRSALVLSVALSCTLFGQGRPTSPTPTPTPGGTIGAGTSTRGNLPSVTNPNPNTMGPTRPIFLSGRVMLDDGTAPPESVSVQRVCAGNPHTETYTDRRGNFSFELGQHPEVTPDASESGGFGRPGMTTGNNSMGMMGNSQRSSLDVLAGCELRAQLAGFRSDSVNLANHRSLDDPDVGTIILHRLGNVEGVAISATSLMAPKDAAKAYEKGLNYERKDHLEEAQKEFTKAVDVYPKYAAAWYELGRVERSNRDFDGARKSFARALEADPKFLKPYVDLSEIEYENSKWADLKAVSDRLLKLDPVDYPHVWYLSAVANFGLKDYEAAEKSAREGIKYDPRNTVPRMNQLLGVLLYGKREYAAAAESFRTYLKLSPNGPDIDNAKKTLAICEAKLEAADKSGPVKPDQDKQ